MDWYQRLLVDTGRSAALWALIGFLATFAITRGITRRIRSRRDRGAPDGNGRLRDVYVAGVHVHHQVWGILLALIAGMLEFRFGPGPPWRDLLAGLFGAGAARALDEFAPWFHLDDVYRGDEGRKSIDAVLVAAVLGVVLLSRPPRSVRVAARASRPASTSRSCCSTWPRRRCASARGRSPRG